MMITLLRWVNALPVWLLCLLLLAGAHPALATHLLGGEMTYRYLDANGPAGAPLRYEITVTIYNNCGNRAIRQSASVGIYSQATGNRVVLTALNYPSTITLVGQEGMMSIPQTSISACVQPSTPPGCTISGVSQPYQLQKFVGVVNLPMLQTGYYAVFTDGNRNVDITNLDSPGAAALSLYSTLAPPMLSNRSPVFSDVAVAIICANDTTVLLNNAVDADGDRLVYTFGQPYATLDGNGVLPASTFLPPPPVAPYAAGYGYTAATPFGTGKGNFAILDPSTGVARYGAATVGRKYAVAVDIKEYRTIGGQEVLIGTTRRDLQLVVASCPPTKPPVLPTAAVTPRSYTLEAGSTLSIPITVTQADSHPLLMTLNSLLLDGPGGYNALLNGDPGAVVPGNPTGTATVSGTNGVVSGTFEYTADCQDARATPYDIALTVKDVGCAGKTVVDVLHITVTKPKGPTAISGDLVVCGPNTVHSYAATGGTAPGVRWRVVGGTIVGSSTANPVQVLWPAVGAGTLVAKGITQYGCLTDSVAQPIVVSQTATLAVTGNLTVCQGSSTSLTVVGGSAPYTVTGGAAPVSGAGPFVLSPTQTTTYTVMGTAVAPNVCGATGQVTVTVLPLPAAAVSAARRVCTGQPTTLGAAAVAGSTYSWSPTTNLSSSTVANPSVTLTNTTGAPITQIYTLTETSAIGCQASHTVAVTAEPLPVAATGAATTACSGSPAQLGAAPVPGYTYSWSPVTGLSNSTIANPTATLTNSTGVAITQTYTLTTTSAIGCVGTGTVVVTVNPLPVAVPGAATTACSGSPAQLGSAPVPGYTYSWSPATGLSNSNIANPTATLTNPTGAAITQTYTLTTTSTIGCVSTGTVVVTVNPLPAAAPGAPVTACSGSPAQLGGPPVAGYTYNWSPATGLNNNAIANPTATLANPSSVAITQTYTLTTTSAIGCVSTGTVVVTVNAVVGGGSIGASQTVCIGSAPAPFTSTAAASGGTGTYTYQWEGSRDNVTWAPVLGATDATYAPGPASPFYYRRRATSGACGTAFSNVVVVQPQAPLVAGVALPTPPAQCAGTAMLFSPVPANAGAAPTYRWFVNGVLMAATPTYTSSTLANGDQVRVELTPTAGFCATGPAVATATVSLTPVPLPTATISAQTPLPACGGAPVTFTLATSTNAGANPQYQWLVDGAAVAGATATTFTSSTLRDGQMVTLALRATTVCSPLTVQSNAVRAGIKPLVQVNAGPDKDITDGDEVTLEGSASGTFPVTWTPATGLKFTGTNRLRPVASPSVTTVYTLAATVDDCSSESTVTVTVHPRVRIPSAISPNGDGRDDSWEIEYIGEYPANHVLVFNRWGSKIFERDSYSRSSEWNGNIGGQPAPVGTYYYVITLGNGKTYSGPLTVVY